MTQRFKSYQDYLNSDAWRRVKKQRIAIDGGCVSCFKLNMKPEGWLNGHHVRYPTDVWNTTTNDLVTLCGGCHNTLHAAQRHYGRVAESIEPAIELIGLWLKSGNQRLPDTSYANHHASKRDREKRMEKQRKAAKRRHDRRWVKAIAPLLQKFKHKEPSTQSIKWLADSLTDALKDLEYSNTPGIGQKSGGGIFTPRLSGT